MNVKYNLIDLCLVFYSKIFVLKHIKIYVFSLITETTARHEIPREHEVDLLRAGRVSRCTRPRQRGQEQNQKHSAQ